MKYEQELLEILPMLRKYLATMMWRFQGEIEDEDIFSECIIRIIEQTAKRELKGDPRRYINRIFRNTAERIKQKGIRERHRIDEYAFTLHEDAPQGRAGQIIEGITERVSGMTFEVWQALKSTRGDVHETSRLLRMSPRAVRYHRKKLSAIYTKLLAANF